METKSKRRKATTYKLQPEIVQRLKRIAEKNGLSRNAVVNLCVASGLNIVEEKFDEMISEGAKKQLEMI
jgi:predicted transcriptional regulator